MNDSADWELAATISRNAGVEGVDGHEDIDSFLDARPDIDTVALALPPSPRYDCAVKAIRAGRNVMLEKPPGRTLSECHSVDLTASPASASMRVGIRGWAAPSARPASGFGARRSGRLKSTGARMCVKVIRGRTGSGRPQPRRLRSRHQRDEHPCLCAGDACAPARGDAGLPENRATPIAADLVFGHPDGAEITGRLDSRHKGEPVWDIAIDSGRGRMVIGKSGAALSVDGEPIDVGTQVEYPVVYARFAELVQAGESEVDLRPMRHVADAFLIGRHERTEPFHWDRDQP